MLGFIKFIFATIRFFIRLHLLWRQTKERVRSLFTWAKSEEKRVTVDTSGANSNSSGGKHKVFDSDEGTYVDFVEEKDRQDK